MFSVEFSITPHNMKLTKLTSEWHWCESWNEMNFMLLDVENLRFMSRYETSETEWKLNSILFAMLLHFNPPREINECYVSIKLLASWCHSTENTIFVYVWVATVMRGKQESEYELKISMLRCIRQSWEH